jgi:hypothetical protein
MAKCQGSVAARVVVLAVVVVLSSAPVFEYQNRFLHAQIVYCKLLTDKRSGFSIFSKN